MKNMLRGGAFLGGNASLGDYKQRENYWINVKLKLGKGPTTETKLKENLRVYYCDNNNKEVERFDEINAENNIGMNDSSLKKLKDAIKKVGVEYTKLYNLSNLKPIKDAEIDIFRESDYVQEYIDLIYKKADGNVSDMNPNLVQILKNIQTLGGNQGNSNLTFTVRNTSGKNYRGWTQVVWETVLYDLKNRKFKCTDLTYNDATGRVNEIVFEEI